MDVLISYLLLIFGAGLILHALHALWLTGRHSSQEQIGCVSGLVVLGMILIATGFAVFL